MKKNRRNNSRPAAITTAKDTTKAIETRAGVLKEAEDVKKEAKTSFYLQYMGKEISTEEITPVSYTHLKSGASREVRPVTRVTSAPRSMQAFAMLYPIFPEEWFVI